MTGDNKAFLRSLPKEIRIEDEGRSILLVHGSPRALNEDIPRDTPDETLDEIFKQARAEVLCVGHTHKPFYRLFKRNWVVNAGSVGRPKHGDPNAAYCLLAIDKQLQRRSWQQDCHPPLQNRCVPARNDAFVAISTASSEIAANRCACESRVLV
jgi:putative phosphoesterase